MLLDKATSDKLHKDVQSYRLVTVATLVDRLKVNGSLARQCIHELEEKGMIKPIVTHSKMKIYSKKPPGQRAFWTCYADQISSSCGSRHLDLTGTIRGSFLLDEALSYISIP